MSNKPLDKGRVSYIAEKFQSGSGENKNRYAQVGRATKWPSQNSANGENIEIELDTVPIGHTGPLKLFIFWDSDSNQNQNVTQGGYQQNAAQGGYQQQPQQQGGYNQAPSGYQHNVPQQG